MAGIDAVHVPYKGLPPGVNDVIAGQVHFMLNSLATHRAAARESGKDQDAGRLEREAFGRGAGDSHDRRDSPGSTRYVEWFATMPPAATPPA